MKTKPIHMNIELTTKCPLACPQCYCNSETYKELDLDTARHWIEEARKNTVESIYLSGGETLCYSHLYDVLQLACDACSNVNIAISGYGFSQNVYERISSYKISGLSVSLNGSTEEVNKKTRDGYSLAINALSILKRNNFKNTIINWVMHSSNCHDFENVIKLAEQYNVSQIIVFGFKPDKNHELRTQPSYEQMKQIATIIKAYKGKVKINIESCFSPLLAIASETPTFGNINIGINKGCLAGISRFSLSVEGKLSPCRHLDFYEEYNSLEEYWRCSAVLEEIRRIHTNKNIPCKDCCFSRYCRPCLAVENKVNGSLYAGNRLCPVAIETKDASNNSTGCTVSEGIQ